jgi:hypothetical protein
MSQIRKKTVTAIHDFLCDVQSTFDDNVGIQVYYRVFEKKKEDQAFIEKQLSIFRNFLAENSDAILHRSKDFKVMILRSSDNAFIDFSFIFNTLSSDDIDCIFNHLLTLLSMFHPTKTAECKTVLQAPPQSALSKMNIDIPTDTKEGQMISNIVTNFTNNIDEGSIDASNPGALFASLFSSGQIGELFTSLQSGNGGEMNVKNIVNVARGVLDTIAKETDGEEKKHTHPHPPASSSSTGCSSSSCKK